MKQTHFEKLKINAIFKLGLNKDNKSGSHLWEKVSPHAATVIGVGTWATFRPDANVWHIRG